MTDSADMNLCTECIGDADFSQWIRKHGDKGKCDFDASHGKSHPIVSVENFAEQVDEYFRKNYQLGAEYRYAIEESDNVQYGTYGVGYEEILGNDLLCNGDDVLNAIIENLPDDCDYHGGEEPFYNDCSLYESVEEAEKRNRMDEDERDYYEIEAALSNKEPLANLKKNLELLSRLLEEKEHFSPDLQKFQLMMVFSFCITSLESYLSDTFARTVLGDKNLKKKYLKAENNLKDQKVPLGQIFDKHDSIDSIIKKEIQDTTFHNLGRARELYKAVLQIDIGDISDLMKLINKRHDFVHRGGKDKDGEEAITTKDEVIQMIKTIRELCTDIDVKIKKD